MSNDKEIYFREIMIWRHAGDDRAIKYTCFQSLLTQKYCVQSADSFYLPVGKDQVQQSELQMIELFIEVSPHERCEWFDSLEEAITQHNIFFDND